MNASRSCGRRSRRPRKSAPHLSDPPALSERSLSYDRLTSACSAALRLPRPEREVIVIRSPEGPRETARRLVTSRQQSTGLTRPPAHNPVLARPLPVRDFGVSGEEAHQDTPRRRSERDRGCRIFRKLRRSIGMGQRVCLATEPARIGYEWTTVGLSLRARATGRAAPRPNA